MPAGAVDSDAELSIRPAAAPPAGPLGLRPIGATLLVRFTRVSRAVTVRLPFRLDLDGAEAPVISRYGEDEKAWSSSLARPLDDGSRRFELATEEFGWFFTGGQTVGDGGPADGGPLLDAPGAVDGLAADRVPPTFLGLAGAEVVGQGMARLTWSEASDDRTAADKLRYRLYLPSFAVLGEPQGGWTSGLMFRWTLRSMPPPTRAATLRWMLPRMRRMDAPPAAPSSSTISKATPRAGR